MLARLSKKLVFKDYFLFSFCGVKSLRQVWSGRERQLKVKGSQDESTRTAALTSSPPPSTQKRPPTFLCTDTMFTLQEDDTTKLERVGVSVDDTEFNIC